MDFKTVELRMSDEARQAMEDRGINEDDIRQVLDYAETEGRKLYDEENGHFLAKKRIGNFTANLEYLLDGESVEVVSMYGHVVKLSEDC